MEIDQSLFNLPLNRLSQIIDDGKGFHIIRILEREDAHQIDFVDAQAEIKDKLKKEKIQQQVMAYVDRLKARTDVWTVFDEKSSGESEQTADNNRYIPR